MSELNLSPAAIEAMREAGWTYYLPRQWFERSYYQCENAAQIARDVSDYTGYRVVDYDTSNGEGYWYVSLVNDNQCFDFARKYDEYYDMRRRIEHALFENVMVITKEQYERLISRFRDYEKRFIGDHVLIAIPEDAFTTSIITILDALGM